MLYNATAVLSHAIKRSTTEVTKLSVNLMQPNIVDLMRRLGQLDIESKVVVDCRRAATSSINSCHVYKFECTIFLKACLLRFLLDDLWYLQLQRS